LVWAVEELPPVNWAVTNISHDGIWDKANGKLKFGPFFDASPRTLSYKVLPPLGFEGIGLLSGQASANGKSTPITGDSSITVTREHPADRNPADWRLTMDEATAYAAAWRAGDSWPIPPNPIPVDYVTRAAALWRGGETYRLDSTLGGPPLWWVYLNPTPFRQDVELTASGAVRSVAPTYVPGEPVDATLMVKGGTSVRAYAIEEKVPAGWQVHSWSDGGQLDTVNGLLKWGPFFDGADRTLRYTLISPSAGGHQTSVSGGVSFDGVLQRTAGPEHLQPGSRLLWQLKSNPPGWVLELRGSLADRHVIERSTDLVTWTPVCVVTNNTGTLELPSDQPPAGVGYYRARVVPENAP
jgi:hypothetical protein